TVVSSPFHYHLRLLPERILEVQQILEQTSRDPRPYEEQEAFFKYMGDPLIPILPGDNADILSSRIWALHDRFASLLPTDMKHTFETAMRDKQIVSLKEVFNDLTTAVEGAIINMHQSDLRTNIKALDEVLDLFDQIASNRVEVIDRPLFFEWNIWRGLAILNYGNVTPNFKMDSGGVPISLSPAGMPDIQAEYEGFRLVIDVTTAFGATQYNMEGEPVFRHVGSVQRKARDNGDHRPVYGLFIANRLTPTVVTDFFARHRISTHEFAGPVSIVPLSVAEFRNMLVAAKNRGTWGSRELQRFFEILRLVALLAPDERTWHEQVQIVASNWLDSRLDLELSLLEALLADIAKRNREVFDQGQQSWQLWEPDKG
ncbi:MAG: AlwI family type II restriction endonuclease, partial [Chloroflexota bacterium]|nr:AlwI family type II restriction endonuclease [Chloroflexota bacterium]